MRLPSWFTLGHGWWLAMFGAIVFINIPHQQVAALICVSIAIALHLWEIKQRRSPWDDHLKKAPWRKHD